MVIDLHRCTGCGGCIFSCKNENNTPEGIDWSSKITETAGTFPNVRYTYIPTLCNHCENAPCVLGCPTSAMHKGDGGLTLHEPKKCVGCRYCMIRCPYGVISFNGEKPHQNWLVGEPLLEGVTAAPAEVTQEVGGTVLPYYNPEREETLPGIRPRGVVEKCTFCDHRVKEGMRPYCVESCPANARIVGDLDDPNSDVSRLLNKYPSWRLRENLGTEPSIYYIRQFTTGSHEVEKGDLYD
jgi:molybdopterin-containing oxidoreductase family iron-sulfur binding subunit